MKKLLICASILLASTVARAQMIEDFENVSDWTVFMDGSSALGGTITQNAANAQGGAYAGALNYEVSAATSNDWIHYKKTFTVPVDMSNPRAAFQMQMNIPANPNMFVQVRFWDAAGKFIEHYIGGGNGQWQTYILPIADAAVWSDYGRGMPDLKNITGMRVEICGDSFGYGSGTVYVDNFVIDTMGYTLIDGFEAGLGSWGSGGPNGDYTMMETAQGVAGANAAAFTYYVSSATGNDYCDFYNDTFNVDLSQTDTLEMFLKMPNDPACFILLQVYDSSWVGCEYVLPEGTGAWKHYAISFTNDLNAGSTFNKSSIKMIRFRVIGDASTAESQNTFYVDHITGGSPIICELKHDVNGDCKITLADFADFATEWLKCAYNFSFLCQ